MHKMSQLLSTVYNRITGWMKPSRNRLPKPHGMNMGKSAVSIGMPTHGKPPIGLNKHLKNLPKGTEITIKKYYFRAKNNFNILTSLHIVIFAETIEENICNNVILCIVISACTAAVKTKNAAGRPRFHKLRCAGNSRKKGTRYSERSHNSTKTP